MSDEPVGGTPLRRKPPPQQQQMPQQMPQQQSVDPQQVYQQQMLQQQQQHQQMLQQQQQQQMLQQQQQPIMHPKETFKMPTKSSFLSLDDKNVKNSLLVVVLFILLNSKIIWKEITKIPFMGTIEPSILALIVNSIIAGVVYYLITNYLI